MFCSSSRVEHECSESPLKRQVHKIPLDGSAVKCSDRNMAALSTDTPYEILIHLARPSENVQACLLLAVRSVQVVDQMGKHMGFRSLLESRPFQRAHRVGSCFVKSVQELQPMCSQRPSIPRLNPKGLIVELRKEGVDLAQSLVNGLCILLVLFQISQHASILVLQKFAEYAGVISFEPSPEVMATRHQQKPTIIS